MMCLPPLCRQPVPVIVTATPCHSRSTVSQASQEDGTCACGCSSRWQKLMQNWKTQVVTLTVKQHEDSGGCVCQKTVPKEASGLGKPQGFQQLHVTAQSQRPWCPAGKGQVPPISMRWVLSRPSLCPRPLPS